MELETRRLHLREWTIEDVSALYQLFSNEQVLKYLYFPYFTIGETEAMLTSLIESSTQAARTDYILAVNAKDDAALIGWCGINIRDVHEREAELGFAFHPSSWGNGFATEATRASLNLAFETLNLHRVFGFAHPNNHGSRHVMEKLGMIYEGTLRQHKWARTAWRDSVLYSILETEWRGETLG